MISKPNKKILAAGPSITQKEVDYVAKAVKNGWDENFHKYTFEFEKKFAKYIKYVAKLLVERQISPYRIGL